MLYRATLPIQPILLIMQHSGGARRVSIEIEAGFVVFHEAWFLVFFAKKTIADGQHFHIGAHKAAEGILRRTHDGFATDVETSVNDHGASRALVESLDESVSSEDSFPYALSGYEPNNRRG